MLDLSDDIRIMPTQCISTIEGHCVKFAAHVNDEDTEIFAQLYIKKDNIRWHLAKPI